MSTKRSSKRQGGGKGLYRSSRGIPAVALDLWGDIGALLETVEFDGATVRTVLVLVFVELARGSKLAGEHLWQSRTVTVLRLTVEFFATAVAATVYHVGRLADEARTRAEHRDDWLDR